MKSAVACVLVAATMLLSACGEPAVKPQLNVQDLQGQNVSLQALEGQPVVVNVWATWCGPCRREMPLLEQAQNQYPDVAFVMVNQGEKIDAIERYLANEQLNLKHVWQDENLLTQQALGYQALPSTYFIDAKGQLVDQSVGELKPQDLDQYIQKIR